MSTKRNDQELNLEQLSQISGGEDGGFNHENPGIGPKEGIFHEGGDTSDGTLNDDQLLHITGGEDGGFNHENPGIGPKEGLFE